MARAPVLAVFSTTVLAQLASVFLTKEAVERLFDSGQHHHRFNVQPKPNKIFENILQFLKILNSHHGGEPAAISGDDIERTDYLFYPAAFASSTTLLIVAYALANQPFSYVLKHAQSSMIQVVYVRQGLGFVWEWVFKKALFETSIFRKNFVFFKFSL